MSRGLILTDVDNTILHFSDAFQAWLERKGHVPVGADIRDTNSICDYLGCDRETTEDLIRDFSTSPEMGWLEPEPCAKKVVPYLKGLGYDFIAITACHDHPSTIARRFRNLEHVFGFHWPLHVTGLGGDKLPFLENYRPSYWVEDHWENAVLGADAHHTSFILDRPYNQGHDDRVRRVRDWHEIEDAILRGR